MTIHVVQAGETVGSIAGSYGIDPARLAAALDRLAREGLQGRLILQVHDELIVECPPEEREQVERILQEEMEGAVSLSVPMVAEAGSGRTWFEAKE